MTLEVGAPVLVVEHDETTREPRELGARYSARVTAISGLYVHVRYDNPRLNGNSPDQFYADSLWRAWDGAMRWRLEEAGRG